MIILLFGNIASGKSTIINKLRESLIFTYYSIDDYRKKYSNGTKEDEQRVKDKFINDIDVSAPFIIIETLGVGRMNDMLFNRLSNSNADILILVLDVSTKTCLNRVKNRKWNIPFPYGIEKVAEIINSTYDRLFVQKSYQRWTSIERTSIKVLKNENITDIYLITDFVKNYINDIKNREIK